MSRAERPTPHLDMSLRRRSRPARPESGISLIEVLVAVVVVSIAVLAAADLLIRLTTTTARVSDQEQARMVAYQVAEAARGYRCGQVYGTETDFETKVNACTSGLTAQTGVALGTCAALTPAAKVTGDTSLCWTDGTSKYNVVMTTWWEFSTSTPALCPPSGPSTPGNTTLPDTFGRHITVTKVGSTLAPLDIVVREAAPTNPLIQVDTANIGGAGIKFARRDRFQNSVSFTRSGVSYTIQHTPDDNPNCTGTTAGPVLFPGVPASVQGNSYWY